MSRVGPIRLLVLGCRLSHVADLDEKRRVILRDVRYLAAGPMARPRVSIPEVWEPPPDVIHLLDLQADHRLKWLATTRAERQQAIQVMATARGTVNDSGYLVDVANAVGEVFKEAAAGLVADYLGVASDVHAGVQELDAIQTSALQRLTDWQHIQVGWISPLIRDLSLWQPFVDRVQVRIDEARREAEIAFSREKLRRSRTGRSVPVPRASSQVRDFFVSHAGEDKTAIARPLAEELERLGYTVWFDEYELTVGDSLRQQIDKGLVDSRFGIVVLSHSFFMKPWPQYELDSLVAKSMIEGRKMLLPVWHQISREEIATRSPKLADLLGVDSSNGVKRVAEELVKASLASHR